MTVGAVNAGVLRRGLARGRSSAGRAFTATASSSLTLRAFVGSRLLVLLAGVGGVLTIPTQAGVRPPAASTHFGALGNVLAGTAVRWDALYYLGIAGHGYSLKDTPFFPLYPLLIRVLGTVLGSDVVAAVLISAGAFAFALVLLHRLTELELGRAAADATVLLVAFTPLSFFFTAVYTESLFLLLSVGSVLAARRQRWALAGVLAGFATLTRVTGILLVVPLVIMHLRERKRPDRQLGWFVLAPVALVGYLAYLAASGFPWMAPFHEEATWGRLTVGPLGGVASAVSIAAQSAAAILRGTYPFFGPSRLGALTPSGESVFLLLVLVVAIMAVVTCFRRMPLQYGAYAAVALMMCISSPVPSQPLVSFDRYALTIFPLWMAGGVWLASRPIARRAIVGVGAVLLVFYTALFSSWSFIA